MRPLMVLGPFADQSAPGSQEVPPTPHSPAWIEGGRDAVDPVEAGSGGGNFVHSRHTVRL